ncbi:MAG TPA: DMT family transporter [Patescibacteria group bacterium]|nr:DMT family transporter [Patescibacteria group bacterium]
MAIIKNKEERKGVLFLLASAFIYSTMPVFIRTLGGAGLPPTAQVFLRYIFAFLAAIVYFGLTNKAKVKVKSKDVLPLLGLTVFGYGLMNLFFTLGILNTQIGNALFLFYSYAIITPILGLIFLKDKINKFNIVAVIFSGIALILLFQPNSLPTWKIGGLFAILASFGQAGYLILRKVLKDYPANFIMLANTFVGLIILGVLSFVFENKFYFQGGIMNMSINTWVTTIILGLANFFAWFAMTKGFEYFKATAASIILLSELIFGIFFAFTFFHEIPTYATFFGGFLILISSVVVITRGEN